MTELHTADRAALERNLRLIPIHTMLTGGLFWLPIFVLFTRARFDLSGALELASIYYLAVVVLEVPSGWMSDRLGRAFTMRAAGASWVIAHLLFIVGDDSYIVIALGQLFLAGGFASLSGTDVSFHYDTLEALDDADSYADRQSRVSALGFVAVACSAAIGGALGLIDLRLAFVASLVAAVLQLATASMMTDAPSTATADRFVGQLAMCARYLSDRRIAWIFFYGILLVTLEHVAFTLMQPWLTAVLDQSPDDLGATPLLAGTIFAATALVGAGAARAAAPLSRRFGAVATLIGFAALSAVVVSAMAAAVSAIVLIAVAFRSAQSAAAPVLISAAVAPHVERRHRATFLSLDSLAGRLGYGSVLLVVAAGTEDDVQRVLGIFSVIAWSLVGVLVVTAILVHRSEGVRATR